MNILEKAAFYKDEVDKLRPFETDNLKQLKAFYRVGLTYSSNSLEGNSLTESETKVVLEDGLTIGGKPLREIYEATGHAKAYDFMFDTIFKNRLSEEAILEMHRLFYSQVDEKEAGKYRNKMVYVTGSEHPVTRPDKINDEMKSFIFWHNQNSDKMNPIEFAALTHKKFVFIHPFIDGNGRISRLLMNAALLNSGYTIAVIPPILRSEYISSLRKAYKDDQAFIGFIAERVVETQKDLLRLNGISTKLPEQSKKSDAKNKNASLAEQYGFADPNSAVDTARKLTSARKDKPQAASPAKAKKRNNGNGK